MAGGTFSGWAPYTDYVQSGMVDGRFATAAQTLLAAGPPRVANLAGSSSANSGNTAEGGQVLGTTLADANVANQLVYPMGIIQNFSLAHNRNFARLFEIGSERSYFIAGRAMGQLSLGRVYYHGASLLRLLYAYMSDQAGPSPQLFDSMFSNFGGLAMANPHDVVIPPGYDNIFVNLASDLFTQPIGLLMYQRDINLQALMATYFEACYVPNHSWNTDSQGVLIQEQVALQFERAVPVRLNGVSLIKSDPNSGGANVAFLWPLYSYP